MSISSATLPLDHQWLALNLTNARRAKSGIPAVKLEAHLTTAALAHARDMAGKAFFAHTGSTGFGPQTRIKATGYNWFTFGENILYGMSVVDAPAALTGWENSPGHLANLLNRNFAHVGIARASGKCPTNALATCTYWAQVFSSGGPAVVYTPGVAVAPLGPSATATATATATVSKPPATVSKPPATAMTSSRAVTSSTSFARSTASLTRRSAATPFTDAESIPAPVAMDPLPVLAAAEAEAEAASPPPTTTDTAARIGTPVHQLPPIAIGGILFAMVAIGVVAVAVLRDRTPADTSAATKPRRSGVRASNSRRGSRSLAVAPPSRRGSLKGNAAIGMPPKRSLPRASSSRSQGGAASTELLFGEEGLLAAVDREAVVGKS
ncbi:hypothetical protein H9P43_008109 [Blastocladiella emersonii ATCC 22665]|nr:hypothetical protein H9P43_008109 [Blastocladiella emersonii ATCC 22665]